jgi:hypothetical protein
MRRRTRLISARLYPANSRPRRSSVDSLSWKLFAICVESRWGAAPDPAPGGSAPSALRASPRARRCAGRGRRLPRPGPAPVGRLGRPAARRPAPLHRASPCGAGPRAPPESPRRNTQPHPRREAPLHVLAASSRRRCRQSGWPQPSTAPSGSNAAAPGLGSTWSARGGTPAVVSGRGQERRRLERRRSQRMDHRRTRERDALGDADGERDERSVDGDGTRAGARG